MRLKQKKKSKVSSSIWYVFGVSSFDFQTGTYGFLFYCENIMLIPLIRKIWDDTFCNYVLKMPFCTILNVQKSFLKNIHFWLHVSTISKLLRHTVYVFVSTYYTQRSFYPIEFYGVSSNEFDVNSHTIRLIWFLGILLCCIILTTTPVYLP